MPELEEIEAIRTKVAQCLPDPHDVLRMIDKQAILLTAKQNYERTGVKLPKDLKEELVNRYHFSAKTIEFLIYESDLFDSLSE